MAANTISGDRKISEFVSPNVIHGPQVEDARTDEANTNLTLQYVTNIGS